MSGLDLPISVTADTAAAERKLGAVAQACDRIERSAKRAASATAQIAPAELNRAASMRVQNVSKVAAGAGGLAGQFAGRFGGLAGMGATSPALAGLGAAAVGVGVAFKTLTNVLERSERVFSQRLEIEQRLRGAQAQAAQLREQSAARGMAFAGSQRELLGLDPTGGLLAVADDIRGADPMAARGAVASLARAIRPGDRGGALQALQRLIDGGMDPAEAVAQIVARPGGFGPGSDASSRVALTEQIFREAMGGAELGDARAANEGDQLVAEDNRAKRKQAWLGQADRANAIRQGSASLNEQLAAARSPEAVAMSEVARGIAETTEALRRMAEDQSMLLRIIKDSFGAGGSALSRYNDHVRANQQAVEGATP